MRNAKYARNASKKTYNNSANQNNLNRNNNNRGADDERKFQIDA